MENQTSRSRATGTAGFLRDHHTYWSAASRWGEDVAAVIMQEAYGDAFSVQQIKDGHRMVRYHIENCVNASEGFRFAASMAQGASDAISRAGARAAAKN